MDDGGSRFEQRYYVLLGRPDNEMRAVPSDTYELRVSVDNTDHATLECRLGTLVDHTAAVEVGTGTFALTRTLVD